jgi:hypothetical protein
MDIFYQCGQRISLPLNAVTVVSLLFNPLLGYFDEVMEPKLL